MRETDEMSCVLSPRATLSKGEQRWRFVSPTKKRAEDLMCLRLRSEGRYNPYRWYPVVKGPSYAEGLVLSLMLRASRVAVEITQHLYA